MGSMVNISQTHIESIVKDPMWIWAIFTIDPMWVWAIFTIDPMSVWAILQ
jgi:hypothetical protein